MTTIAPCPCGKTPTGLNINTFYSAKHGQVCGNCCGKWIIEFRTEYNKEGTAELHEPAVRAWNEAERGIRAGSRAYGSVEELADSLESSPLGDTMEDIFDELRRVKTPEASYSLLRCLWLSSWRFMGGGPQGNTLRLESERMVLGRHAGDPMGTWRVENDRFLAWASGDWKP